MSTIKDSDRMVPKRIDTMIDTARKFGVAVETKVDKNSFGGDTWITKFTHPEGLTTHEVWVFYSINPYTKRWGITAYLYRNGTAWNKSLTARDRRKKTMKRITVRDAFNWLGVLGTSR